jgi:hypothetical protein
MYHILCHLLWTRPGGVLREEQIAEHRLGGGAPTEVLAGPVEELVRPLVRDFLESSHALVQV